MNKPTIDTRREELIAELTRVNDELHKLRLRARALNDEFLSLKNGSSSQSIPPAKPAPKTSTSAAVSKARSPKPAAPEDDLMLGGVSD